MRIAGKVARYVDAPMTRASRSLCRCDSWPVSDVQRSGALRPRDECPHGQARRPVQLPDAHETPV